MSVVNALIVAIGLKKKDEISRTYSRLEKIWDEYDVYEKVEGNNF
ncbi:MAG: N-acetylmannosamine kinase, partial [Oscillospiraceae bacterium]